MSMLVCVCMFSLSGRLTDAVFSIFSFDLLQLQLIPIYEILNLIVENELPFLKNTKKLNLVRLFRL